LTTISNDQGVWTIDGRPLARFIVPQTSIDPATAADWRE